MAEGDRLTGRLKRYARVGTTMGGLAARFGLRLPLAAGAIMCLVLWLWARRRQATMAEALEGEAADPPGDSG